MRPMPAIPSVSTSANQRRWMQSLPWIDRDDADIEAYCRTHPEPMMDLPAKLAQWREDGVVIFENAIPDSSIAAFEAEMEAVIRSPASYQQTVTTRDGTRETKDCTTEELRSSTNLRFNNIHFISPAARHLSLAPTVVRFLRHIFAETPCTIQTLSFNRGSQQPAHADFAFVYNQTDLAFMAASWIPLEDVHPDSGPLAYYPGTHKVASFGFYDFGDGEIILTDGSNLMSAVEFSQWLLARIDAGGYQRRVFLPKRGDVLLWHAALVHEGTKIADPARTRRSFVTHYTAASKMPETHLVRDGHGEPLAFTINDGLCFKHRWVDYSRQVKVV